MIFVLELWECKESNSQRLLRRIIIRFFSILLSIVSIYWLHGQQQTANSVQRKKKEKENKNTFVSFSVRFVVWRQRERKKGDSSLTIHSTFPRRKLINNNAKYYGRIIGITICGRSKSYSEAREKERGRKKIKHTHQQLCLNISKQWNEKH